MYNSPTVGCLPVYMHTVKQLIQVYIWQMFLLKTMLCIYNTAECKIKFLFFFDKEELISVLLL